MCHSVCPKPWRHAMTKTVDLPCGCQDIHRACGCVCLEHAHVECSGKPLAAHDKEAP